jgi:hypothetical protein
MSEGGVKDNPKSPRRPTLPASNSSEKKMGVTDRKAPRSQAVAK